MKRALALVTLAISLVFFPSCGVVFAPISFAEAVSSNANYAFKGTVMDPAGKPLEGVVAVQRSDRRLWAPIEGTTYQHTDTFTRVDRVFALEVRGTNLQVTFSKEGYHDAVFRFDADSSKEVSTNNGDWRNTLDFAVLLVPVNARDAYLSHASSTISYDHYPIADTISLPNLLTEGATGAVVYKDKDATDLTVIPDGTLYAVIDSQPPKAINNQNQIDPADLDIPNSVTLKIAGPDSGFIRITPRPGLHPMLASTEAPESGYASELTFDRARLKEMRLSGYNSITGSHEYFYFKSGDRFGKGTLTWSNRTGKPEFTFDLYIQRRANTRDLTTFNYKN